MRRAGERILALVLAAALPGTALAAGRPGAAPQGGGRAPAPAPISRPAPRPAPQAAAQGGFNFNRDINARPAVQRQPVVRPAAPQQAQPAGRVPPPQAQRPNAQQRPNAPVANFPRAPYTSASGGPYQGRSRGPVIRNPHVPGPPWGWNHGIAWYPAPIYWGGGFWGAYAFAALATAVLFGTIIDYQQHVIYPSYEVEPDTPGAEVLADYGLQQTPCGPPDLVVIWGPGNSVICAYPNDQVAPGNYVLDPATLTIAPAL